RLPPEPRKSDRSAPAAQPRRLVHGKKSPSALVARRAKSVVFARLSCYFSSCRAHVPRILRRAVLHAPERKVTVPPSGSTRLGLESTDLLVELGGDLGHRVDRFVVLALLFRPAQAILLLLEVQ